MGNTCCKKENDTKEAAVETSFPISDIKKKHQKKINSEVLKPARAGQINEFVTHKSISKAVIRTTGSLKDRKKESTKSVEVNTAPHKGSGKESTNTLIQPLNTFNTHEANMKEVKAKKAIPDEEDENDSKSILKAMKSCLPPNSKRHSVIVDAENFKAENTGILDDKYEQVGYIDSGAFGEVRKVRDKSSGQLRALKVMRKSRCQKTNNFADEIKILQKLVFHKHQLSRIIRILFVFMSSIKMKKITIWLLSINFLNSS